MRGRSCLLVPYTLLWRAARPLLRRNKRLAEGFAERLVAPGWPADLPHGSQRGADPGGSPLTPVDLWIQSASGGEAYLAVELLKALNAARRNEETVAARRLPPLRVLCTTCTRQGRDVLAEGMLPLNAEAEAGGIAIELRYFPLDEAPIMRRALAAASPRLIVLLETEIWPALMAGAAEISIPIFIINGRLRKKSLRGYRLIRSFLHGAAPERILAISDQDAARFAAIFGQDKVGRMDNIKFARLSEQTAFQPSEAAASTGPAKTSVTAKSGELILFSSVRKEEEALLLPLIPKLLAARPTASLVVAPRHTHRAAAWEKGLRSVLPPGTPLLLRSRLEENQQSPSGVFILREGSVTVWDKFGEMQALYAAAGSVFVGGTLKPLGGQNFLEPLAHGLRPCIGPYWENFRWAGNALVNSGLVRQVGDTAELADALIALLQTGTRERAAVRDQFAAYIATHTGGAAQAAALIAKKLTAAQ